MSYNKNKVEFIANKIKNTDDVFLSNYSKNGCQYWRIKDNIMESVNNCIKSEINTFKKVYGTKFITLPSNEIHEQKSDPELARLMMPRLKKKVVDVIEKTINLDAFGFFKDRCQEFVERQLDLMRENHVIKKMKSHLEEYGSEMCDKKIEDLVKHNIEEELKGKLKNVNDLFY